MTNRELLFDMGHEDYVVFDNPDYDEAIIGISYDGRVIYDFDLMVKHLMTNCDMDEMEAVEFIDYNCSYSSPYVEYGDPIIMYRL